MTPEEIEETRPATDLELFSFYTFEETSPFKIFMVTKYPRFLTILKFTMDFLFTMFKMIAEKDNLVDPTNPAVIVCSNEMRNALQVSALHYSDMFRILRPHIILMPYLPKYPTPEQTLPIPPETPNRPSTSKIIKPKKYKFSKLDSIDSTSFYESKAHLKICSKLYRILSSLANFPTKEFYTYEEIEQFVIAYIRLHYKSICTTGNPHLLTLIGHPLCDVFKYNYVHRTQIQKIVNRYLYRFPCK